MGLLNFLAKKSYPDLAGHDSLKTSAYDTTVASSPPIRGTYPVLGNGTKILEEFQRSHPNLANISRNNSPAPSPLVPRLRGPGVERPRTAPSSQLADATASGSLRSEPAPTLPVPSKKKYGPYKLPPRLMTDVRDPSSLSKPAPSPSLVSMYSESVRSSENGKPKGYVDLLDAQSMIRPSDFYSRVQAAGARNYGEDVADRNREEKSSNLDTERAQDIPTNHTGGDWATVISKDVDDDDDSDEEPHRPLKIRHSVSSGLRHQKAGSRSSESFPKRTSSRLPPRNANEVPKAMTRTESARSERAARRKSMPSFAASASGGAPRSASMGRKGKDKDIEFFPDSLRNNARSATAHEREYSKPNISSKRQSLTSSHIGHQSPQQSNSLDKPLPALPPSARSHSRRKTTSHGNAVLESRLLAKRQSVQGMSTTSRGEIYEDTYQEKKSLQAAQPTGDRNSSRRQLGSTTDLQDSLYNSPAQQPDLISQIIYHSTNYADNEDHPSQSDHRKQSAVSLSNQSIMVAYETGNTIPERNSSLRRWSLTSETAMSSLSSNPFRPQSGHTTNTSVDFSPLFPRTFNDSIPPVPNIPSMKSLQSIPKSTSTKPPPSLSLSTSRRRQSDEFFLEEQESVDGSSPSLSRGSYEKDLLFQEASYGVTGDQVSGLPGLFDTALSSDLSTGRTWGDESRSVSKQFHMPEYPETDPNEFLDDQDQAESSDEELNFDIPRSRASSALHYTPVQERFSIRPQPLEEDDDSDF